MQIKGRGDHFRDVAEQSPGNDRGHAAGNNDGREAGQFERRQQNDFCGEKHSGDRGVKSRSDPGSSTAGNQNFQPISAHFEQFSELAADGAADHGNRAFLPGAATGSQGNRGAKALGKQRSERQLSAFQVHLDQKGREPSLQVFLEQNPERDNQQAADGGQEHHQDPLQGPVVQRNIKEFEGLFEDQPMNQFDGFPEKIVAQASQNTDQNCKNDQKGIFTDFEVTQNFKKEFLHTAGGKIIFQYLR